MAISATLRCNKYGSLLKNKFRSKSGHQRQAAAATNTAAATNLRTASATSATCTTARGWLIRQANCKPKSVVALEA